MYFYYLIQKRYQYNYQQAKCMLSFFAMLLPVLSCTIIIGHFSLIFFHCLLFLEGWLTWTFAEYILHRFWMHDKNSDSAIAQTHHYHHTHPTELAVTTIHRLLMVLFLASVLLTAIHLGNY